MYYRRSNERIFLGLNLPPILNYIIPCSAQLVPTICLLKLLVFDTAVFGRVGFLILIVGGHLFLFKRQNDVWEVTSRQIRLPKSEQDSLEATSGREKHWNSFCDRLLG